MMVGKWQMELIWKDVKVQEQWRIHDIGLGGADF
jgi:hypothetical protein